MTNRVVLIDDEATMRRSVEQWLALSDFKVDAFSNGLEAIKSLSPSFNGVVVSDVKMPHIGGLELLEAIHQIDPDIPVVLMTGHGEIAMAVEAMKKSAHDFLEKPFSPEQLLEIIKRAQGHRNLLLENRNLRKRLAEASGIEQYLIGKSPQLEELREEVANLASTNVNVLLLGETGTGKEVVARALHKFGDRKSGPFMAINCGAIPDTLFESELFGHEAGAFTGAQSKKIGAFEYANGGTLFLDEVTSLPQAMQVKLLRVLQDKQITRLGTNTPIAFDVRIVAATNDNIDQAIESGHFRRDLYYRINTIKVRIPPLRERGEDITLLFSHFVGLAEREFDKTAPKLFPQDILSLIGHNWPGNVRELKNVADRFTLSRDRNGANISKALNDKTTKTNSQAASLSEQMNFFERTIIADALSQCSGNISEVMRLLDLPRRTLNEKMLRHGLTKNAYKE